MADRLITCRALLLLSAFQAVSAFAEDLSDPTRPPAMIAVPEAVTGQGADAGQTSGLRSIIISRTRRAAIIDGETVELGKKHGDARLIEVNEGSVVLRGAQGRQVLTLFPDVKMTKKVIKTKAPLPASKAQSGKDKNKPVARDEKPLSGQPKEEK